VGDRAARTKNNFVAARARARIEIRQTEEPPFPIFEKVAISSARQLRRGSQRKFLVDAMLEEDITQFSL
jgi:hypothetical protein